MTAQRRWFNPDRAPRSGWGAYAKAFPERAKFYNSAVWRGVRARHLAANPDCIVCGEKASVVDHIRNRAEGGADLDLSNLESMCRRCHGRKTQAESHRGAKRAAVVRDIQRKRRNG